MIFILEQYIQYVLTKGKCKENLKDKICNIKEIKVITFTV